MKVFTVDEYMYLPDTDQAKVNQWLANHNLLESAVIMVTSRYSRVYGVTPDVWDDMDVVSVYCDPQYRHGFKKTPSGEISYEDRTLSHSDHAPNIYQKTAEFEFDDFPWEVQKVGE